MKVEGTTIEVDDAPAADDTPTPGEIAAYEGDGLETVTGDGLEVVTGELLPAPLSESAAKSLDNRIRAVNQKTSDDIGALFELLAEAQVGQLDVVLGYDSWSAYLSSAVTVIPSNRGQRKALVSTMTGMGVSERIVAGVLGVSQPTVSRDLAEAADSGASLPDEVIGKDGRTTKPQRKSKKDKVIDAEVIPEEPPAKVPPVSQEFKDEMGYLANSVAAFKDIMDDDRFAKAAKTIAKHHLNRLQEHISTLTTVVDCLMEVTI